MKIFAFTDLHGNKKLIPKLIKKIKKHSPDIIICAGDLSNFGINLKKLILKFDLNIPFLIIPGNHETSKELTKACKNTNFAINIHQSAYQINNIIFFGYGLGGFDFKDKILEKITPKLKKNLKEKVILVTHQPPYKTKLDYLNKIGHRGNISIRRFIQKVKPLLSISGHLHENQNKIDRINSTVLINPGPKGKLIII